MKRKMSYKKDILFKNNISEIESISLDCNYEENRNDVQGEFIVSGSYKPENMDDLENFSYTLEFIETLDNIVSGSVNIEISDFTYEIDNNKLIIFVDYILKYEEEKEELDEDEFRKFLDEHEVDVVNLKEETVDDISLDESPSINIIEEKNPEEERLDIESSIIKNISNDDNYITYNIHVISDTDTLDNLSLKYNISVDEIKNINNIEDIKYGMKIIIPVNDENN